MSKCISPIRKCFTWRRRHPPPPPWMRRRPSENASPCGCSEEKEDVKHTKTGLGLPGAVATGPPPVVAALLDGRTDGFMGGRRLGNPRPGAPIARARRRTGLACCTSQVAARRSNCWGLGYLTYTNGDGSSNDEDRRTVCRMRLTCITRQLSAHSLASYTHGR